MTVPPLRVSSPRHRAAARPADIAHELSHLCVVVSVMLAQPLHIPRDLLFRVHRVSQPLYLLPDAQATRFVDRLSNGFRDRRNDCISESLNSADPKRTPMSHSTHIGFNCLGDPLTSASCSGRLSVC